MAIIDFIYLGEANVHQENLDSFFALAEELQLNDLTRSGDEEEEEKHRTSPLPMTPPNVQGGSYSQLEAKIPKRGSFETEQPLDETGSLQKNNEKENYSDKHKHSIVEETHEDKDFTPKDFKSVDPLDEPEAPTDNPVAADLQALKEKIQIKYLQSVWQGGPRVSYKRSHRTLPH